ncbi:MAG: prepilin peptidase CpaA [Pseudomonadota bacterium]|nr:prepilin peptidase CpaA [Pseudomonadota bacterium]
MLLVAAWHDIKDHRIPNPLVVAGALAGVFQHARMDGWHGLAFGAEGIAVGFAVLLPFYVMRMLGAGDVKLMAMVGAFLGPWGVLGALLATFLAGGVLALGVALRAKAMTRLVRNLKLMALGSMVRMSEGQAPSVDDLPESVGKLPYAVAIASGTLGYLIWKHVV